MSNSRFTIQDSVWKSLLEELKLRGGHKRESGAFLLGPATGSKITEFYCFDDLDPQALDTGIIVFNSSGFVPLWAYCNTQGLKVFADVHTHPKKGTGLSGLDIEHPMVHQKGHIGLIVPYYAQQVQIGLKGIGVHEYLGNKQWKTWKAKSKILKILPDEN